MVFTDAARNRVRSLAYTDMSYGMVGTDATQEAVGQTALLAAITATSHPLSTSVSDKTLTVDYTLAAGDAVGSTLREYGAFGTTAVMYSRTVFTSMVKSSTEQWQISVVYKFV